MNLTSEQRAWYLEWLYEKPHDQPLRERKRLHFLLEFHVPTAFELLSEVEAWPTNVAEPEPGELIMQRWFRLFRLKTQFRREAQTRC
jgi:hypothetical protein